MVAGPPCSNCGWTLRWVPEQNAWGCDRCRSVFPAQQQPQAAPQPSQAAQSWAQPNLGTASGVARAGGAFGGSAGAAGRSQSVAPGQYQATPSQFSMPPQPYPSQPPAQSFPPQAYPSQPPAPAQQSYLQQPAQRPSTQPPIGPGGYPQNVYGTPGAQATANETPSKPRSKRGLWIAIGGVVAVGAGIAIAVGMSGGGKSSRGLASKDEVVKATLAALTAGDADALLALTAPEAMGETFECDDSAKKEIDKGYDSLRDLYKERAKQAKGVEIELVKSTDDEKQVQEKGSSPIKGCKLKVDVTTHKLKLNLKLKKGSVAKERGKKLQLAEVDGRWFLTLAPVIEAPGDCAAAAKTTAKATREVYTKQGLGDSGMARIEKAVGQHCDDDQWADEATLCFTDATTDKDNGTCMGKLTQAQQDRLVGHIKKIVEEDKKSREVPVIAEKPATPDQGSGSGSGSDSGSGAGSGSGSATVVAEDLPLPPVCDDYKAEIEKLAKCRRIKADVRQAQMKRHDLAVEAYNNARKKDLIRESTERVCKIGLDHVLDLRKTLCR